MQRAHILTPAVLACILLAVYLATIAPGLTWANNGADGGDLITAAATGGVPHPTGYPTYLSVATFFQRLPLGSLALRTNVLSAVMAVLSAVMAYGIVCWLPGSPAHGNRSAGLLAGLMFGLAPLVWSQAIITEVYALHGFFISLALFLALAMATAERHTVLLAWLTGITLGLSLGNHLTTVLMIPPVLILSVWKSQGKWQPGRLARTLAGTAAGSLVYLALPLRALSGSPVNWGNPVTLKQFIWLVSGDLYQRRLGVVPPEVILARLQDLVELLLRQFELPGIALAAIGLIFFFKPSRLHLLTIYNAVAFTVFSILYASLDSFLYIIPVILSFSVWVGLGIAGLFNRTLAYPRWVKPVVFTLLGVFIAAQTMYRAPLMDLSKDRSAEAFGGRIMESAPVNALIFAEDDRAIFTLWYFHFALKQREDIAVIATDLLHFEWYDQTLRSIYPEVAWPEGFLWKQTITAANPARPACTIAVERGGALECAALP